MVNCKQAGALLVALLAFATPGAAIGASSAAQAADYSIAFIRFDVQDRARLGPKRAGLLCLPNGSLSWGDIDHPAGASLVRVASAALSAAGLSLAEPSRAIFEDVSPPSRFTITAVITGVSARVCAPQWGLGRRDAYKGSGRITTVWSVYEQATRSLVHSDTLEQDFEMMDQDGGSFAAALERTIAVGAVRFAQSLSRTPAAAPAN